MKAHRQTAHDQHNRSSNNQSTQKISKTHIQQTQTCENKRHVNAQIKQNNTTANTAQQPKTQIYMAPTNMM